MMSRNLSDSFSSDPGTGRTMTGLHRVIDIDETMLDSKVASQMFA